MSRFAYDYYDVDVDPVAFHDPGERSRVAFQRADTPARYRHGHCFWYVVSDDGIIVRVCRKRHA